MRLKPVAVFEDLLWGLAIGLAVYAAIHAGMFPHLTVFSTLRQIF